MPELEKDSFLGHLEALRRTLLACVASWAIALPVGWILAPFAVAGLLEWCRTEAIARLHFFSPLEVFMVQLKTGCVLAAVLCFPYAVHRLWRFFLPALYENERRAWRRWIVYSSLLFLAGGGFCVGVILPIVMEFSATFASEQITPVIGISQFMTLAGALVLAFGAMFQMPIWVCLLVGSGLVRIETLRASRPYVLMVILVLAALFTPPDIISQVLLALPTWLLFELGLFLASRRKPAPAGNPDAPTADPPDSLPDPEPPPEAPSDDTMLSFYEKESDRDTDPCER